MRRELGASDTSVTTANAARGEIVDRGPDPRMIEGDGSDAVIGRRKLLQRAGQRIRIEHIDMKDVDEGALAGQPFARCARTCSVRLVMKLLAPVGRMKAKRKLWLRASRVAAAIGAVTELGHRRFDPRDGLARARPRAG